MPGETGSQLHSACYWQGCWARQETLACHNEPPMTYPIHITTERRRGLLAVSALLLLAPAAAAFHHDPEDAPAGVAPPREAAPVAVAAPVVIGSEQWAPVTGWGEVDPSPLGNTHGGIVVDPEGHVYYNTDTERAIMVHDPDGTFVRTIAQQYPGIHGMQLRVEEGTPYIYAAHLHGKQVLKLRLDGTMVWALGVPMESGKYDDNPNAYNPTAVAVAPDGRIYVADGYGRNWIHVFGPDLVYQSSFGGRGTGPGQFQTCHGLMMDEHGDTPYLVVCDRENRRLQRFDLDGNHVDVPVTGLRRPCAITAWSGEGKRRYAVAELEGRVTLLDGDWNVLGHLGDNPDQGQWARNGVPTTEWIEGVFTAPHGCCFDADGNLYVMDWNAAGRMTKMQRTPR